MVNTEIRLIIFSAAKDGEALYSQQKSPNAILGCNLKNDRMISVRFQGKPGDLSDPGIKPRSPVIEADALTSEPPGKPSITAIQVYAPTSNAEEAEVERVYEDLQDLLK